MLYPKDSQLYRAYVTQLGQSKKALERQMKPDSFKPKKEPMPFDE